SGNPVEPFKCTTTAESRSQPKGGLARSSCESSAVIAETGSGRFLSRLHLIHSFVSGGNPKVVAALQPDPELGGVAEVAAEAQRRVRRDSTLAADKVIDPRGRDVKLFRKPVGTEAQRLHKLG